MGVLNYFVLSLVIAAVSGDAWQSLKEIPKPVKPSVTEIWDASLLRHLSALPEDPSVINTRFLLNTRTNPVDAIALVRDDALGLYNSPYNSTKKTVFLIHGWTNDANHPWIISSVREILINEDANVISVDWAPGAGLPYLRALTNAQVVGAEMSLPYFTLNDAGLDPSTIYFEGGDVATHLDPTDALLVDVIHTDKTFPSLGRNHVGMGFETNTGHVDIIVNNGQEQPGCKDTLDSLVNKPEDVVTLTDLKGASSIDQYVCSHLRAADYFVESINSACPYSAFSCSSWDSYLKGTCYSTCRNPNACTSLGYHTGDYPARGTFHLDTQSTGPYCNLVLRMEVDVSPNQVETKGSIKYILIGDVGQTKEDELYNGIISNGFILAEYVTVAGSNAYRIGKVGSVRLRYQKDAFKENEIVVQKVIVQQAETTINAVE
ncbi:lipoxygenase-like protein [Daphnia pulex]|uniref:Lipoxygenase-like protein n=1 Tax=Daphnia pulex TaxID=6669 RepID=E9FVH7_DAPPU|nr:lipoxygenase-like protein [Daphnia pulex]|eukprot:EFX88555.1 lipoxygenase-like protein [Daphnia pulex]